MKQSKLPLYAYVDETGNTGHNIFDEVQPDFFTAALITKGDFDSIYASRVKSVAESQNLSSLHGKELGFKGIEHIAEQLLAILKASRASFFVSRVEKRYLLATKLFDSLFDSGENAAVAWHNYNLRALRIILAFKLASTLTTVAAKQFWSCILEKDEGVARQKLKEVCELLLEGITTLEDHRAREILSSGLIWASENPESIQIHTDRKIARQGHFPNLVAFGNLLDGLQSMTDRTKCRVARITHDEQGEFQKTLKTWHGMFSNALPEPIHWAGETYSLQKVAGSNFDIRKDNDCAGIQVIDVVLWLYSQFRKGKTLPPSCEQLLLFVFERGWESDFSFQGVERTLLQQQGHIMFGPISEEQERRGREGLVVAEQARQASMDQYRRDRLPPFMRNTAIEYNSN